MFEVPSANKTILTVSKLNRMARGALESEIGQVWLTAQISNFVAASSGHWYFTLKDNRAQVKAAMFKGQNRRLLKKPKEGDQVLVRANISLYEPRGDYQLIVEHIEPEGEGQLKQQFEALKNQLSAQGLFAQEHKQPIPQNVRSIGVITSATGAALHDILTVLKRRNPSIEVIIYPTQVQGDHAAAQICEAIFLANKRQEVDVLIVGRGGGSLEDLWSFNEESVARAIYSSGLVVISAVGHEVDISIADFCADIRAATPSAAAEMVSQDQSVLLTNITTKQKNLISAFNSLATRYQHQFQNLQQRLQQNHPHRQLQQKIQTVDQSLETLTAAFARLLSQFQQKQQNVIKRLGVSSPARLVNQHQTRLTELQQRLNKGSMTMLSNKKQRLNQQFHLLDTVSPLATLSRGYSITFAAGDVIKKSEQVKVGEQIVTRISDAEIHSEVKKILKSP